MIYYTQILRGKAGFSGYSVVKNPYWHQDSSPQPSNFALFFTWSSLLASDLLLSCTVGPQLVASTHGELAAAAIATVLVTSKQTQSLYMQRSSCPAA